MSKRWPRTILGVQVIYIRDYVARKVVSVVVGGRAVWALLPDGRVGTNDADLFRYAIGKGSRQEAHAAEKLWRLGKLKKAEYQKIDSTYQKKQTKGHQSRIARELKSCAKQLGMVLTKEQSTVIDKLTT